MTPTVIFLNVTLVFAAPALASMFVPRFPLRPIGRGAIAAAAVLLTLILVRELVPGVSRWMTSPDTLLWWLFVVALSEEIAKQIAVGPSRIPARGRADAVACGLGFASVENLLYLMASPATLIVRILTAGALHVATVLLYSRRRGDTRSSPLVDMARLTVGTALHFGYNTLIASLDTILIF